MQRRAWRIAAALLLAAAQRSVADDMPQVVEYGHLRGRFVYDGVPPMTVVPIVAKGVVVIDERLVVNPKNSGIANIGVWLEVKPGQPLPPIHPSYGMHIAKPDGPRTKTLTIAGSRFEPRFLMLRTDETLTLINTDKVADNAKIELMNNPPLNLLIPREAEKKLGAFAKPERLPTFVSSGIHPWMRAIILVKDHPYAAVTDSDGNFEIRNVAAGEHDFQFWHEAVGYITKVTKAGVVEDWPRGERKVKIPADDTLDLGLLLLSPKTFP